MKTPSFRQGNLTVTGKLSVLHTEVELGPAMVVVKTQLVDEIGTVWLLTQPEFLGDMKPMKYPDVHGMYYLSAEGSGTYRARILANSMDEASKTFRRIYPWLKEDTVLTLDRLGSPMDPSELRQGLYLRDYYGPDTRNDAF